MKNDEVPTQAAASTTNPTGITGKKRLASVSRLLKEISPILPIGGSKVTIVGTGAVGMASAFALLTMGVATDLALVDMRKDAVLGEQMNLVHGQALLGRRCQIKGDSHYSVSAGSKICVVTAGARQNPGESRLDLVQKNVTIFKTIIPNVVKYSPKCIFIIVSNPCDIMAWVTWKLSGFPRHRVFGSGTTLDTSRFRYLLGERLGIGSHSVHGYIIGEHGDSSVPVWSTVNIAGSLLKETATNIGETNGSDPENWAQVHKNVTEAAYKIIELKGYTSWAIGVMVAKLCEVIIKNQRSVVTISTLADGFAGIKEEVFLSMPCVLGETGISHVVNQKLSDTEHKKLLESVATMRRVMGEIKL